MDNKKSDKWSSSKDSSSINGPIKEIAKNAASGTFLPQITQGQTKPQTTSEASNPKKD